MSIHPTAIIDETVRIYGRKDLLHVGEHTRLDAYCVITVGEKGIWIGKKVHISSGVYLFGSGGRILIKDRCTLSPRAMIFTSTDQFQYRGQVGPLSDPGERVPLVNAPVILCEGSGVGAGGILWPGTTLLQGALVGSQSEVESGETVREYGLIVGRSRLIGVRQHDRS